MWSYFEMWTKLAHIVIKYRLALIILLGVITVFMGYKARTIQMDYDLAKLVPQHDPDYITLEKFKAQFGEDGNILAIGIKDSSIYKTDNFRKFSYLTDAISDIHGVNNVLSLANIKLLKKNTQEKKFELQPLFKKVPGNQQKLDSLLQEAFQQKFYSGQLVNNQNGATLILVTVDKHVLNSADRQRLMKDIEMAGSEFEKDTHIDLHYAGLPYVRSVMMGKVRKEILKLLALSVLVTGLILWLFFRSWDAVVFPMIVIFSVVIWSLGTLALFGFKVSILTGLIPTIIVVIGVPNSIYLINKYHQEFEKHGNKMRAISTIVRKIGLVTLITNFTTAIGFIVLALTDIKLLRQFGIVAGINIFAAFFVSIILIPAVFSYLPEPGKKQLKHLDFKILGGVLDMLNVWVHKYRPIIYTITIIVVGIAFYGVFQLRSVSYMVDDLPKNGPVKSDLRFFEDNFSGVMPLEVVVDTGHKRGAIRLSTLQEVDQFQQFLGGLEPISQPVSIVNMVKAARQAYYNNSPAFYSLPNRQDYYFILRYFKNQKDETGLIHAFMDSSMQKLRISLKVADIGSHRMDTLIQRIIEPKAKEIFAKGDTKVTITGTTPIFIKGNKYLVENLRMSLVVAFFVIALIMGLLFANFRMILISLVPNMIPLIITAGFMGYLGVPLKPSTALIFSIAFGISVDDTIHFLAKYRQELYANNFFVPIAVGKSLKETGASMMYTSIVLFAGFIVFVASEFGGTIALGSLTGSTLLVAMVTNLVVLPSLLLTFDSGKRRKNSHPLIEQYDNFHTEEDDEEIDLDQIKIESGEEVWPNLDTDNSSKKDK